MTPQRRSSPPAVHPAAHAWAQLADSRRRDLDQVTITEGPASRKSMICRLSWPHAARVVVAKRASLATLSIERTVYQDILPSVPVPALHCYGLVAEAADSELGWLFLQEASGETYASHDPMHRTLAAEWLAVVHSTTSKQMLEGRLPPVGTSRYLGFLQLARKWIDRGISNAAMSADGDRDLRGLLDELLAVEDRWHEVERICAAFPPCLVHGDFIAKNATVSSVDGVPRVYLFDWEASGWGVPAEDLAGLPMDSYAPLVMGSWRDLDRQALDATAAIGGVFQGLALIQATSEGLLHAWPESAVEELQFYRARLAQSCEELGWR